MRLLAIAALAWLWSSPVAAAPTAAPATAAPAAAAPAAAAPEAPRSWPRAMQLEQGTLLVYQPQLEKLDGMTLSGRAAVSWQPKAGGQPVFGVFWFEAQILVDKDKNEAGVQKLSVMKVRFPNSTTEKEAEVAKLIEAEVPKWDLHGSLDEIRAAIAVTEREEQGESKLKSAPPKLVFSSDPALLLLYDGQPVVRPLEKTGLERVANAALLVLRDPATKRFYLVGDKVYYEAPEALGPWTPVAEPSPAVKELIAKNPPAPTKPADASAAGAQGQPVAPAGKAEAKPQGKPEAKAGPPPRIVVATEPTELIVFDGKPSYVPVGKDASLLYADNCDHTVLVNVPTSETYLLVAGRWFKASSLEGPWTPVRPDQLPAGFKGIPSTSPASAARPFVSGTPEADDARADAQIPQTAAVKRDQTIQVTYDGEPQFKAIEGTPLAYAVNTQFSVIQDSGKYWCCHQAVWYVAPSPKGPWTVSDKRPPSIDQIPPSAPVYNVKYVYVYQSTPEVVYVGYLPGYVGVYPYYGTVVYGTGYYYPPYISPVVCYPYPATWGVHMTYNPWTGFGVGVSYGTPFFSVSFHFGGYGGYYGPYGYRPPPYPPYGYRPPPPGYRPPPGSHPGYPGYRPPAGGYPPGSRPPPGGAGSRPPQASTMPAGGAGGRPSAGTQPAGGAGGRPSAGTLPAGGAGGPSASTQPSNNLYNRPENSARNAPRDPSAEGRRAPTVSNQPNNVYGDKSGNVYRQNQSGGWDKSTGSGWQSQPSASQRPAPQQGGGGTRPSTQPSPSRGAAPSGLGSDAAARSRSGGYGGGGRGGGGGGRGGGRR